MSLATRRVSKIIIDHRFIACLLVSSYQRISSRLSRSRRSAISILQQKSDLSMFPVARFSYLPCTYVFNASPPVAPNGGAGEGRELAARISGKDIIEGQLEGKAYSVN